MCEGFPYTTVPQPTRFVDNAWNSNSIIDLIFLSPSNLGFGHHILYPEIWKLSDYVSLTIKIGIKEINIDINI